MENDFLKKSLALHAAASWTCEEVTRYGRSHELSIRSQCRLLGIHRSGFYYVSAGESEENLALMRLLDERHLEHPTHGVLQMQDYLRDQGYQVNHKRMRRLLRKMGLMAIYPKRPPRFI